MVKTVARSKAKKKKWVEIVAPKVFRESPIGDSHVAEPEDLVGRQVSVNMMELTNNPRNQHIEIDFQIKELKDGKAQTFTRGFEIVPSAVKRYVRKGRNRIDDSFVVKTKDGFSVRVKPLVVTHSRTTKEVETKIRLSVKDEVKKAFSKKKYSQILDEILNFRLQKSMKDKLTKIHPIRTLEIRSLKLLDNEKIPEELQLSKKEEDSEESEEKEEVSSEEEKEEQEAGSGAASEEDASEKTEKDEAGEAEDTDGEDSAAEDSGEKDSEK